MAAAAAAVSGDPSGTSPSSASPAPTARRPCASPRCSPGRPAARVIGTLTGARTTPEAPELQAQLAGFRADGVDAVAMEVSSHALALHRVDGTRFAVAVFTNLSRTTSTSTGRWSRTSRPRPPVRARQVPGGRREPRRPARSPAPRRGDDPRPVSARDVHDVVTTRRGSSFTWRGRRVELPLPGGRSTWPTPWPPPRRPGARRARGSDRRGSRGRRPVPGRFEPGGDAGPVRRRRLRPHARRARASARPPPESAWVRVAAHGGVRLRWRP